MGERFVELADRGVTLCAVRGGAGPPLLVLNGTGSDLRNQPNALRWPIATTHDVLTYDHRCLGRSVQADAEYQPSMADFAADALALVDAEGIGDFDLIGVSFGGMVAQEVAIMAGSRVAKLVLCCTSSGGEGGASYPLHELYENHETIDQLADLWDVRAAHDETVADAMQSIFDKRPRPAEPPPGLLKQLEARRHHDTWDRLAAIVAPTLVAYGLYDGVADPGNSERLAERIGNATLAPFVGGHLFLWQDERAWPAITEFLLDG